MAQIIRTFSDGSTFEFDSGKFDAWCIYLKQSSVGDTSLMKAFTNMPMRSFYTTYNNK
jgi:hypothetical protein